MIDPALESIERLIEMWCHPSLEENVKDCRINDEVETAETRNGKMQHRPRGRMDSMQISW